MPAARPLSRRTTVGLAGLSVVGVAGLAGCSDLASRAASPASATTDADAALVTEARAQLAQRLDLLRRTTRRHPDLTARLRPFAALHRRHAEVLTSSSTGTASAGPDGPVAVPRQAAAALAVVRGQEKALQAELASLAVRARSGALARVLASMSAGTAQRLADLTAGPDQA